MLLTPPLSPTVSNNTCVEALILCNAEKQKHIKILQPRKHFPSHSLPT